jgi:Cu/Zn superoxide dismutase
MNALQGSRVLVPFFLQLSIVGCGSSDDKTTGGSVTETAQIAGFGMGTVTGTASFAAATGGVQVTVTLQNCPDGAHPTHVHEGTSCADATTQGAHWGPAGVRGEGIPPITCASGTGTVTYLNPGATPDKVWTLDGNATTDPMGHAFVVHSADGNRIGCGVITK